MKRSDDQQEAHSESASLTAARHPGQTGGSRRSTTLCATRPAALHALPALASEGTGERIAGLGPGIVAC